MLINSSENLGFEKRNEVFATFIEHHYEVLLSNVRHCTKKVVSAAQFVSLGSDLWLTLVYHTFTVVLSFAMICPCWQWFTLQNGQLTSARSLPAPFRY